MKSRFTLHCRMTVQIGVSNYVSILEFKPVIIAPWKKRSTMVPLKGIRQVYTATSTLSESVFANTMFWETAQANKLSKSESEGFC